MKSHLLSSVAFRDDISKRENSIRKVFFLQLGLMPGDWLSNDVVIPRYACGTDLPPGTFRVVSVEANSITIDTSECR